MANCITDAILAAGEFPQREKVIPVGSGERRLLSGMRVSDENLWFGAERDGKGPIQLGLGAAGA